MPFSLGAALVAGLSPSASASSSLSSASQSSSSGVSPSLAQRNAFRRVGGCASLEKTTPAIMLVNRARMLQPRKSLHSSSGSSSSSGGGGVASRLHTMSTASRIFGFDMPPSPGINNFHALDARRRNSASVAPSHQRVAGDTMQRRTSRYVPSTLSTSNSVGGALADKSRRRDSISLSRATEKFDAAENYDDVDDSASAIDTASRRRKRQESRLYDEDALTRSVEAKCALSVMRVNKDGGGLLCVLARRNRANVAGLRRSSSTATNSPSSCASSASSSSPSCASLRSASSVSSTSCALSNTRRAAADDRNNHPNEKIVRRANCVDQVSSRLAFYRLYEFGGLVGQGNFSNVHVVYAESSGVKYAVKEIDKTRMHGKTHFVENEIAILKRCTHRNICRLFEAFQCAEFYFLVFEYAPRGDLFETIKRMSHLSERAAAQITFQVASALGYLHARRIVHRDVKPENVLLGAQLTAKITDFGLACTVMGPLYRVCGTPTYVAPEVLTQEGYGVEVDVWSLGVLLYVMLIGFAPFRCADRAQLFRLIVKAKVSFDMPSWSRISPRAKQLIVQMLTPKSMLRLKAHEVLTNEWIRIHNDARNERDEL